MKFVFLTLNFLFLLNVLEAQVTNTQPGNWNNSSHWSTNTIPDSNDAVSLSYNIIIDADAYCYSLNLNGHNLTVNSGAHLYITGNSRGDTLLSRFTSFDTTVSPADTGFIYDFSYDSLKRNTVINYVAFSSGTHREESTDSFFYNGSSRFPYKAVSYSIDYSGMNPFYYYREYFLTYQNGRLITDSTEFETIHYFYFADTIVQQTIRYSGAEIIFDTVRVEYNNYGNIVHQSDTPSTGGGYDYHYVYDTHPNPFYRTQLNLHRVFNSVETFIMESIAMNNLLYVEQYYDWYHYEALYEYQYGENGFPSQVWALSPNDGQVLGKAVFIYTR